jgi:hypothetical protein
MKTVQSEYIASMTALFELGGKLIQQIPSEIKRFEDITDLLLLKMIEIVKLAVEQGRGFNEAVSSPFLKSIELSAGVIGIEPSGNHLAIHPTPFFSEVCHELLEYASVTIVFGSPLSIDHFLDVVVSALELSTRTLHPKASIKLFKLA